MWTERWSLILDVIDKSPGFNTLFVMMFTSLFGNNLTPGAAGGEPMRAYLLSKFEGISFDLAFVSASADRVFEFFPFVLVSGFAVYMISTWNIPFLEYCFYKSTNNNYNGFFRSFNICRSEKRDSRKTFAFIGSFIIATLYKD